MLLGTKLVLRGLDALRIIGYFAQHPRMDLDKKSLPRPKTTTASHCAFSSNLFHGQIVQIAILQLSDSECKKFSP